MSPAATAVRVRSTAPARRAAVRPRPAPVLKVLAPPTSSRWRPPFVAVCASILVLSLLGLLAINITLSRGAYTEHVLELRQIELNEAEQALSEDLAVQASPAVLSQRARELGMIPNVNPAFIRLSDGAVLGAPAPADPATAPSGSIIPAGTAAAGAVAAVLVPAPAPPAGDPVTTSAAVDAAGTEKEAADLLAAENAAAEKAAAEKAAAERAAAEKAAADEAAAERASRGDAAAPVTPVGPAPPQASPPSGDPPVGDGAVAGTGTP